MPLQFVTCSTDTQSNSKHVQTWKSADCLTPATPGGDHFMKSGILFSAQILWDVCMRLPWWKKLFTKVFTPYPDCSIKINKGAELSCLRLNPLTEGRNDESLLHDRDHKVLCHSLVKEQMVSVLVEDFPVLTTGWQCHTRNLPSACICSCMQACV